MPHKSLEVVHCQTDPRPSLSKAPEKRSIAISGTSAIRLRTSRTKCVLWQKCAALESHEPPRKDQTRALRL